jgi:hypothetical protein
VSRADFTAVSRFLRLFARNTERAVAEIARIERESPASAKRKGAKRD